jgi:hypothetical protein
MFYEPDEEILELKKRAHANYRDLARVVMISPSAITKRVMGWSEFPYAERKRVLDFLREKIAEQQRGAAG